MFTNLCKQKLFMFTQKIPHVYVNGHEYDNEMNLTASRRSRRPFAITITYYNGPLGKVHSSLCYSALSSL